MAEVDMSRTVAERCDQVLSDTHFCSRLLLSCVDMFHQPRLFGFIFEPDKQFDRDGI